MVMAELRLARAIGQPRAIGVALRAQALLSKGKEQIAYFQAFLRDLWNQTKMLHDQKVPVADAAKRIDLTAHREHYRNINGPGFQEATIARVYQLLDQRGGSN